MISHFCGPFTRRLTGTRIRVRGVRVGSRPTKFSYRLYNRPVIVGVNEFKGFCTYDGFPRYHGAGPVIGGVGIAYPIYGGNRIVREGSGGGQVFCKYSHCPRYRFVS